MGRPVFKFALPDGSLEYVGRVDVACNVSPIGSRGNVLTHGNFLSMQAVSNRMRGANCHGRQRTLLRSTFIVAIGAKFCAVVANAFSLRRLQPVEAGASDPRLNGRQSGVRTHPRDHRHSELSTFLRLRIRTK